MVLTNKIQLITIIVTIYDTGLTHAIQTVFYGRTEVRGVSIDSRRVTTVDGFVEFAGVELQVLYDQ
jgi:hypothetical protein